MTTAAAALPFATVAASPSLAFLLSLTWRAQARPWRPAGGAITPSQASFGPRTVAASRGAADLPLPAIPTALRGEESPPPHARKKQNRRQVLGRAGGRSGGGGSPSHRRRSVLQAVEGRRENDVEVVGEAEWAGLSSGAVVGERRTTCVQRDISSGPLHRRHRRLQWRRRNGRAPHKHGGAMIRADAWGVRQGARRRTTAALASDAKAARRDAAVMDVLEGTTNRSLQHVPAKTFGDLAMVDGRLHCIGDRIDHGVHGRSSGSRHCSLPCRNPARSPVSAPASPSVSCLAETPASSLSWSPANSLCPLSSCVSD